MLTQEEQVDIIAMHRHKIPIKEIARRSGFARNTVRSTIRRYEESGNKSRTPASKLDPYKDHLVSRLEEFPSLSVEKLYREINSLGYSGGKTILAEFTKPYRIPRKKTTIRFETDPGEQAQVDFAELGHHKIGGRELKLSLFTMILCYSRMLYGRVVTSQDSDTFLNCHSHAFAYFGGVTREILYDNAKVVALKHTQGSRVFNTALLDYAANAGFSPRLCKPYRPQTKGKVERSIGYIRDSFLEGETFTGIEDMQTRLEGWLGGVANVRIHQTTQRRPVDMLAEEELIMSGAKLIVPPSKIDLPFKPKGRYRFGLSPEVSSRSLDAYEVLL